MAARRMILFFVGLVTAVVGFLIFNYGRGTTGRGPGTPFVVFLAGLAMMIASPFV